MDRIPRDAKADDVTSRKKNQFRELAVALNKSTREGAPKGTAWAALQAITSYVDHDRSVKSGDAGETVARFNAAQFGSGDQLKGKALGLLLPLVKDRVPVAA